MFRLFIYNQICNFAIRKDMFENNEQVIVPVVILKEGVHQGSNGALLYTNEEIKKFPQSWNGVPVTVDHPDTGCDTPRVLENQKVGRLWNVRFEDDKLKGECWLDENKTKKVSPAILDIINNNGQLEISSSMFADVDNTSGQWNDKKYDGVAKNYRPDHLALLPGGIGACSYEDGCGIRNKAYTKENKDIMSKENKENKSDQEQKPLDNNSGNEDKDLDKSENAVMLSEKDEKVLSKGLSILANLFSKSEDKKDNIDNSNEKDENKMSDKEKDTICSKVQALIDNKATQFTEDDREMLAVLKEDVLDKLVPVVNEEQKEEKEDKKDVINNEDKKDKKPLDNEEEKEMTTQQYISNAPESMQEVLNSSLKLHEDKKDKCVKNLLANKRNVFKEDDLRSRSLGELEGLASLAQVEVDYSVKGIDNASNSDVKPMAPIGLSQPKKGDEK